MEDMSKIITRNYIYNLYKTCAYLLDILRIAYRLFANNEGGVDYTGTEGPVIPDVL